MRYLKSGLVALCIAALVSGCATPLPKQQAYDRAGHAQVKTIHVMPMSKVETQVLLLNSPAASFGLLGALFATGQAQSRQERLMAIYAGDPLNPREYFRAELTKDLEARGYAVVWPSLGEPTGIKHDNVGLHDKYSPIGDADAILDVNLNFFGFVAGGVGHQSPYRPTASMAARLMSADGKQTYFTDYFAYNNIFNSRIAVAIEPDPQYAYPGFGDIERAGKSSEAGLKLALSQLAQKMASEL